MHIILVGHKINTLIHVNANLAFHQYEVYYYILCEKSVTYLGLMVNSQNL